MSGWIKIYRKLLKWEWYNDKNCRLLFIHCLLMANHEDAKWRGVDIKKGSFISSLGNLSQSSGLTIRELRTALTKLKSTNELTSQGHAEYTVFTVVNYNSYQSSDTPIDKPKTSKRQASDKQATTDKEELRIKEERERIESKVDFFEIFWNKYPNKTGKKPAQEKFNKLTELEIQSILKTIDAFAAYKPFDTYSHPHATTYLNQRRWEDEIPKDNPNTNLPQITRDVWHIAKQIPAEMKRICKNYNLTEDEFKNMF